MLKQVADDETKIILDLLFRCLNVDGDVVELGCYEGDTSLLFAEMLRRERSDKKLWIYDSFEGLPEKTTYDDCEAGRDFQKGELCISKKYVKQRFLRANLPVPVIKKGWFCDLTDTDLPSRISFAFLDGDLYESIRDSLALVGPVMDTRGIIVVHDYNNEQLPGVTRAVDEWLGRHREYRLSVQRSLAVLSRA